MYACLLVTEPESLHDSFNRLLINFYQSNSGGFGLLVVFGIPPFHVLPVLSLGMGHAKQFISQSIFVFEKVCVGQLALILGFRRNYTKFGCDSGLLEYEIMYHVVAVCGHVICSSAFCSSDQ